MFVYCAMNRKVTSRGVVFMHARCHLAVPALAEISVDYYLRQGGYVFVAVRLFVCLCVCLLFHQTLVWGILSLLCVIFSFFSLYGYGFLSGGKR